MPTRLFPMLSAADFDASIAFYRDLLGGVETYRFPQEDPAFVSLSFGESELGIGAMRGAPLHGEPQRPATGHRMELCVYVEDVDATVAAAVERGVRVVLEPADQPWGERVAYVADPDGNLILLVQGE
jgi:lactoylglutathione lyase